MYPSNMHFTRQQMSSTTGLGEDILAYWLKEGIIRSTTGGSGKGSHRKFDYVQIHIAAILREVRQFGVNIASLREVAEILQRGVAICSTYGFNRQSFREAAYLSKDLAAFRNGCPVPILDLEIENNFRPPVNEDEVIRDHAKNFDYDDWQEVAAFALSIHDDDVLAVRLYADLIDPDNLIEVGVGKAENWDEKLWSLWKGGNGRWHVNEAHSVPATVMSHVSIAVSLVIRRLWAPK